MGWMRVAAVVALGAALAAAAQWAAEGLPGAPLSVPEAVRPALPWIGLAVFGIYLAAAYGGRPGAGLSVWSALAALMVAGLPLLYTYGVAQHYGLPQQAGPVGTLLAGSVARGAAAVWFAVAAVTACRGQPARASLRLPPPHLSPVEPMDPEPFWDPPAPAAADPGPAPVAYTPESSGRV